MITAEKHRRLVAERDEARRKLAEAEAILASRPDVTVPAVIAERTALRYRLLAAEADNDSRPVFAKLMREWAAAWVAAARGDEPEWPT